MSYLFRTAISLGNPDASWGRRAHSKQGNATLLWLICNPPIEWAVSLTTLATAEKASVTHSANGETHINIVKHCGQLVRHAIRARIEAVKGTYDLSEPKTLVTAFLPLLIIISSALLRRK